MSDVPKEPTLTKAPPAAKPVRAADARGFELAEQTLIALPTGSLAWDLLDLTSTGMRNAAAAARGEKAVRRGWEVASSRGGISIRPTNSD